MPIGSIAICSRALLKLGASTISSFDEGTAEAEVSANLYPMARDALLSVYPWSFAVAQTTLPKLSAKPIADFANAFKLPPDFLRIISAGIGRKGRGISYRIIEDRLHTNSESVNLTYIFKPDERNFPPYFTQVLIARLSAELCIPLTESSTRAELLMKIAEEEFKRARLIDAQQDTPKCFEDYSLVEVRK